MGFHEAKVYKSTFARKLCHFYSDKRLQRKHLLINLFIFKIVSLKTTDACFIMHDAWCQQRFAEPYGTRSSRFFSKE